MSSTEGLFGSPGAKCKGLPGALAISYALSGQPAVHVEKYFEQPGVDIVHCCFPLGLRRSSASLDFRLSSDTAQPERFGVAAKGRVGLAYILT